MNPAAPVTSMRMRGDRPGPTGGYGTRFGPAGSAQEQQELDVPLAAGDGRDGVARRPCSRQPPPRRGPPPAPGRAPPRRARCPPCRRRRAPPRTAASPARSAGAPGLPNAGSTGSTSRSEMNETSMTIRSTRSGKRSGGASRMFTRSSTRTRGSEAIFQSSCPCPTSTQVTRAAPALQQAVGEAAGRGADVQRRQPARVDPEDVQRVRQLEPAARHVGHRRRPQPQLGPRVDQVPRLVDGPVPGQHLARQDQRPRPLTRGRQPLLDQGQVRPNPPRSRLHAPDR